MKNSTAPPKAVTPPELARRWRVNADKILGLIRDGELRAFNIASKASGRPRWRISEAAIEAFELRRSAVVPAKSTRRSRRKSPDIIEFF